MKEPGEQPLYKQIARALRAEVEQLHPGDALGTEADLEQRFNVSRITIRRAIDKLAQDGLVLRRPGQGTFVARNKVSDRLGVLYSWTERMQELGLQPRTVDCEILQIVPPIWVSQALRLNIASPEPVLRIQRLRFGGDEPLAVMTDYLRLRFAPDLAEKGLEGESLYDTLEKRYNLELIRAEDGVVARRASLLEARLLDIEPDAPILQMTRITYVPDDEPIGVGVVVSRADRYEYRVTGYPRRRQD
jgi:GntR family transcriptional regulator